jgi:hypothetical protein
MLMKKYGLLMTSLMTQFSMGTNQYPNNVLAAVDIFTNHQFGKREPKNTNQRNRNRNIDDTVLTVTMQSSFNLEATKKAMCYYWAVKSSCSGSGAWLSGLPKRIVIPVRNAGPHFLSKSP